MVLYQARENVMPMHLITIYIILAILFSLCTIQVPFQKKGSVVTALQKVISGVLWPLFLVVVVIVIIFSKDDRT
jgi:hypothetical protein